MSTKSTPHDPDASLPSRRHILKLLGLVAATGRARADSVAIGGGGADHGFRYGGWSFAPPTLPPDDREVAWVPRDGTDAGVWYPASLPQTWQANGIQWSVAGDLAAAESNASTRPAVCVASDGASLLYPGSLPQTWTAGGVEHVAASDLGAAESERTQRPAVLWGQANDHAEVVF